jgi:antitoxin ParD1/3/4
MPEDQRRKLREKVDAKLLAALDSGDPIEITREWWEQRRKEFARRIKARRAPA